MWGCKLLAPICPPPNAAYKIHLSSNITHGGVIGMNMTNILALLLAVLCNVSHKVTRHLCIERVIIKWKNNENSFSQIMSKNALSRRNDAIQFPKYITLDCSTPCQVRLNYQSVCYNGSWFSLLNCVSMTNRKSKM